jgi:hypothetical protein
MKRLEVENEDSRQRHKEKKRQEGMLMQEIYKADAR